MHYKSILAIKIVIPSMLVILLSFIIFNEIRWQELLLVSNLIDNTRVVAFPIWYTQVVFQIALILTLPIFIFNFSQLIKDKAITTSLIALCLSLCIWFFMGAYQSELSNLPHFFLWNFTLGWVVWALLKENDLAGKVMATSIVLITICCIYLLGLSQHYRVIIIALLSCIFIWCDHIKLWKPIGKLITLTANAIFVIFLFHHWGFELFYLLAEDLEGRATRVVVKVIFSVSFCIVLWAFLSALYSSVLKILFDDKIGILKSRKDIVTIK